MREILYYKYIEERFENTQQLQNLLILEGVTAILEGFEDWLRANKHLPD